MTTAGNSMMRDRGFWIDCMLLLAVWLASVALVQPLGDFPLNDDWSYGLSVKQLLESGEFRPGGWTAMSLLGHALWGALFAKLGGFSFTVLRLSTLVLGFVGLVAICALARRLQLPRMLALLLALSLAFNPVYYALSLTFMTDVPFTAWITLAALCLCMHLQSRHWLPLLLGSVVCVVAILSRQLALAVPLAFALSLPLTQGLRLSVMCRALLPLALSAGALFAYDHWLEAAGRMPAMYATASAGMLDRLRHPQELVRVLGVPLGAMWAYLGLFALPALPVLLLRLRARIALLAVAMFALLTGSLWGHWMPMVGNVLVRGGIGPLTLKDTYILGLNNFASLPQAFWQTVTVAALASAAVLIATMLVAGLAACRRILAKAPRAGDAPGLFLLASALCYLVPVLLAGWFDRYLLPAVPMLLVGTFALLPASDHSQPAWRRYAAHGAALALLLGCAGYSVAAAHDYLAWNRTRWQLINGMTQQGVSAAELDGGFEFNGLMGYEPGYVAQAGKSWWWVKDDRYIASFALIPGYIPARVAVYEKWLPPSKGTVFILQRPAP